MRGSAKTDRRTEILAAARAILAREGAAALTLRAVAAAVGIKLASLQYYYPTYAKLIEALAEDLAQQYWQGLSKIDPDSNGQDRLEAVLRWFATETPGDVRGDARLEVQFWALAQVNEDARHALAGQHAAYLDVLASAVKEARPALSDKEARWRAMAIASLLEGATLFVDLVDHGPEEDRADEEILRAAMAIALAK